MVLVVYESSPQRQVKISKNYAAAGSGYKGVIPHCSGKSFSFYFSSTYYLLFAAAVKKVHLPLRVPLIVGGVSLQDRHGGDLNYKIVVVVVDPCRTVMVLISHYTTPLHSL